MMIQMFRLALLCAAFSAQSAFAVAKIEPSLLRLLNSPQESQRNIVVMLVHKNLRPQRAMILNRAGQQMAMMQNAQVSQSSTVEMLNSLARQENNRVQYRRYWLVNSVMVSAPVRVVRQILQQNENISYARPAMKYRLIEPKVHRETSFAAEPFTYGLQKLRVPELRDKIGTADGRGIRVAILDTGIDADHPDLKGKVLLFKDFIDNQTTPYDDHGHGTHVAGTIAGGATSGTSIGVAPGASLIIGKIFDENGSSDEATIMDAMQWVADPDGNPSTPDAPMLVSNSWGGGRPGGDPNDAAECRAVDGWVKLSILPVFAAGNSGPSAGSVSLPGGCPAALAVGATDENDKIASFSSRGPAKWSTGDLLKPLISAPGVRVHSAAPGGRYVKMSGTSMATPHVSGVAALVLQARPNSRPEDIAKLMMAGSIDLGPTGPDQGYGYGRLDVIKTMEITFGIRR